MARLRSVVGLLKALGLVSWRNVRSLGSIGGQNFFLFVLFVALQPESAVFFALILGVVLLFPLSSDPMRKVPGERRAMWPLLGWEWTAVRVWSLALSPIVWLSIFLLVRAGWRVGAVAAGSGASVQVIAYLAKRFSRTSGWVRAWARWPPAPPGAMGAIMRLQWREMLRTLDPYIALALVVCTELYRFSGRPLDPAALRIMSLVTVVAVSTETQVLFGIDGHGAARYHQLPIRGWRILLAKDLAFLALLGLLVMPLDFVSGFMGGVAALAIGHRRSVLQPVRQTAWRFTSGALFPDGVIQVVVLFWVGNAAKTVGLALTGPCILAWLASLLFYGWQWDRRPDER